MLREVVLDTETTGTDLAAGDRVVEIGMVELLNHIPTGFLSLARAVPPWGPTPPVIHCQKNPPPVTEIGGGTL